jgi:syntaxin 7
MSFEDFDAPRVGSAVPASYQAAPTTGYGDELSRLEAQVISNTRQLAASVNQLSTFLNTLGSGRDSQQLRDRIAALVESTRDVAKATATDIKELSSRATRAPSEVRARIPKLNKDLQTWLTKFQELSRIYQKKITSVPVPPASTPTSTSRMPAMPAMSNEEMARQEEQQSLLAAKHNAFMYVENERSFNDSLIREREEGIQEIEQSITEVNDIFRELASITVQQSSLVDDIESNIENTAHNAAKGVSELQKASELQRSSRSKICCIAITIAVIVCLAVAFVYVGIRFF